ncbi:MAG: hypothetical protein HRT35_11810 [Algicola sp.]|nr:hypothetical protein [Algicola sp.]
MTLNKALTLNKIMTIALLTTLLTACGSGGGSSPVTQVPDTTVPDPVPTPDPTPDPPPDPTPDPAPTNDACGILSAGDTCISLEFPADSGLFRHYILRLPIPASPGITTDDTPKPLLIAFHGAGWHANAFHELYHLGTFADNHNYITLIPESTFRPEDGSKRWNTSNAVDRIPNVDDVGFTLAMIEQISTDYAVDMSSINLFGWSNGGFMSSRMACEYPELISGIFTFGGNIRHSVSQCSTAGSVAISYLHGTSDSTVPYNGSLSGYIASPDATHQWAEKNACTLDPQVRESYNFSLGIAGDETDLVEYHDCVAPVQHVKVNGGSHGPSQYNFILFHQVMADFYLSAKPGNRK